MNFANKMQIIQKIVQSEQLVTAYSAATNMPLIDCSNETFNDRAFAFENEDLMKTFVKPWLEKKVAIKGLIYLKKERMKFFATLDSINVDELVYVDKTGVYVLKLTDIIKKPDFSKMPVQNRPVENPQLQMSGLYFVQEAARNVPQEQKQNLKDMEEELSANIVKGIYLMPMAVQENKEGEEQQHSAGDEKQVQFKIPLLKDPKGNTLQPVFTDNIELSKFAGKEKQARALKVPFAGLEKLLAKEAYGYILNPGGFHINISREQLQNLSRRFNIVPAQIKIQADDTGKV